MELHVYSYAMFKKATNFLKISILYYIDTNIIIIEDEPGCWNQSLYSRSKTPEVGPRATAISLSVRTIIDSQSCEPLEGSRSQSWTDSKRGGAWVLKPKFGFPANTLRVAPLSRSDRCSTHRAFSVVIMIIGSAWFIYWYITLSGKTSSMEP